MIAYTQTYPELLCRKEWECPPRTCGFLLGLLVKCQLTPLLPNTLQIWHTHSSGFSHKLYTRSAASYGCSQLAVCIHTTDHTANMVCTGGRDIYLKAHVHTLPVQICKRPGISSVYHVPPFLQSVERYLPVYNLIFGQQKNCAYYWNYSFSLNDHIYMNCMVVHLLTWSNKKFRDFLRCIRVSQFRCIDDVNKFLWASDSESCAFLLVLTSLLLLCDFVVKNCYG